MSDYVIAPPAIHAIPVAGSAARFPVRRVWCIGRNYAEHVVEMGGDPDRSEPFFFQKNRENLDPSGEFPYPARTSDVHHEVELAVALHSGGTGIAVADALTHVFGYASALDMTRRDLQAVAKKAGRPWEVAKAFERSAPIGAITPAAEVGHPDRGAIRLWGNGSLRQEGDLGQMIWKLPEIISYLSEHFEIGAGDVILTGTPSGVGPVAQGDRLRAEIEGLPPLDVTVV